MYPSLVMCMHVSVFVRMLTYTRTPKKNSSSVRINAKKTLVQVYDSELLGQEYGWEQMVLSHASGGSFISREPTNSRLSEISK